MSSHATKASISKGLLYSILYQHHRIAACLSLPLAVLNFSWLIQKRPALPKNLMIVFAMTVFFCLCRFIASKGRCIPFLAVFWLLRFPALLTKSTAVLKSLPDYFARGKRLGHWQIMHNYVHHRDAVFYAVESL